MFEGVHDPSRLRIVYSCITVTGVVRSVPLVFDDGDYCFDIIPLDSIPLTVGSIVLRKGAVHVEIVPADQPRILEPVGGICPGDVVRVTGVYVVDTDHGLWAEIHPALEVEVIERHEGYPDCVWSYVAEKARGGGG